MWHIKTQCLGDADITISGGSTLAKVNQEIGKKNGVYIILNGNQKDDVAALWQYAKGDVIEGRNNIDKGGTVYFWELKGEAGNRNSFVGNVLHLILPNAPKRFVSDFITVAGEKIFVDYDKQDFFKDKIEGPAVYRKEQVNVHISLIDMSILSNIDFARKSQLSTIKERYKDRPDVYKKLASGESHYIFMPKKHYSKRYEDFAFAYYHELAHILHPEGVPRNSQLDAENIRSEYVADETAVAKLGWRADNYREYIRETFGRDWLDKENWDEEPSKKHHWYARSRLLKSLEYDEKKQVGR